MKDTQIHDAVTTILSGLELSEDKKDSLLQNAVTVKSNRKRSMRLKLTVALVVVLSASALLGTSVGMPMLRIFKKLEPETYKLQIDMDKPMPGVFVAEKQTEEAVETWGQSITDTIYDFNICTRLPEWKPERFSVMEEPEITIDETFGNRLLVHYAAENGHRLRLSVWVLPEDGSISVTEHIQHEEKGTEIWKYGDVEYVFLKNYEYHSLNWQENNCTIRIHGIFDRDEALKMVKSIYD